MMTKKLSNGHDGNS